MITFVTKLLVGGLKRAFTKDGGTLPTVTNEKNVFDPEAYVALAVRGIIIIVLAWLIAKLGLSPDLINSIVTP